MQAVYRFQAGSEQNPKLPIELPSPNLYTMLPREWPLARMSVSFRRANMLLRATLWRRVAELNFRGCAFEDLPELAMQDIKEDIDL